MVRELIGQENISLLSLQETKLDACSDSLVMEICGAGFDFFFKPASNNCGGILLAWRNDVKPSDPIVLFDCQGYSSAQK